MGRLVLAAAVLAAACADTPAGPGPGAGLDDSGHDAGIDADAGADASVDAGPDGGTADAEVPDASLADAGLRDAGDADAGSDAGATDGGLDGGQDAGGPDAGGQDAGGRDFVVEGFGASTRGGWQPGGDEVVVTSLSASGPASLREALDSARGPRIIRFGVDGTIALTSALVVPSNVTIDGRGHRVTLTGKGLILPGTDDVIVLNLAFEDIGPDTDDGLRIGDPVGGASERVVVDHCTFRATGNNGDSANVDEAISVIFGSRDITLAWLRFESWEKILLVGNGDAPASVDAAITLSVHHLYARSSGRRHPQARHGVVDLWNVFLDDWHMYDWFYLPPYRESFGAQSQDGARLRVEQSLFKRAARVADSLSQANDATRCESGGSLDGVGLMVTPDSTAPLQFGVGCTGGTGWARPYSITLDAAGPALRARLETQAGNTL